MNQVEKEINNLNAQLVKLENQWDLTERKNKRWQTRSKSYIKPVNPQTTLQALNEKRNDIINKKLELEKELTRDMS